MDLYSSNITNTYIYRCRLRKIQGVAGVSRKWWRQDNWWIPGGTGIQRERDEMWVR